MLKTWSAGTNSFCCVDFHHVASSFVKTVFESGSQYSQKVISRTDAKDEVTFCLL
jgi:hypothetical protein